MKQIVTISINGFISEQYHWFLDNSRSGCSYYAGSPWNSNTDKPKRFPFSQLSDMAREVQRSPSACRTGSSTDGVVQFHGDDLSTTFNCYQSEANSLLAELARSALTDKKPSAVGRGFKPKFSVSGKRWLVPFAIALSLEGDR